MTSVSRRLRYYEGCKFVAEHRFDLYHAITFDRLLPLAFYLTQSDLKKIDDIHSVLVTVTEEYEADKKASKTTFEADWRRYCSALKGATKAFAIFEGAIYVAAESIESSDARQAWINQCLQNLRDLRPLTTTASTVAVKYTIELAEISQIESFVGGFLFTSMMMSGKRVQEEVEQMRQFTHTMCLICPRQAGQDFEVILRVDGHLAKVISGANSERQLRHILGEVLYTGVEISLRKKHHPFVSCLQVSDCTDGTGDISLQIIIGFATGQNAWGTCFNVFAKPSAI